MACSQVELRPVRTHILTSQDNIIDVIQCYAKDDIGPDDVVCVAESVLAITQGRYIRPEDMDPCFLAKIMCRFVPQKGSLGSVYGMQSAMNLEGKWKVFFAMLAGMATKVVGMHGVFYKLAGAQAALIDDVTGTMPPFDKHLVYGPSNPEVVTEEMKQKLGCYGAAVADVNDLKKSWVIGTSKGTDGEKVAKILIDNPFGNASQKTPIVIIKNYAKAVSTAKG